MIKRSWKRKLIKLHIFVVVFCCALILGFALNSNIVVKAEAAKRYKFNSPEAFKQYSIAYAGGERNEEDVLEIAINSGNTVVTNGFISLGTPSRPFAGEIVAPTSGIDIFSLYNCPLFDYVTTDFKISGSGTINIMRSRVSANPETGVLTSGSLFANHVIKGTNAANWNINLLTLNLPNEGSLESMSYECVIGDIADEANVTINFTNSSSINVVRDGDAGLICGSVGANASLTVSTSSSGSNISVTSNSGNAGSLVGKMGAGSTLTLASSNASKVTAVTSTLSHAGGLVGYATNANLGFSGTGVDYLVKGTIEGFRGAGGVFGYYKNTDNSRTFSLNNTLRIDDAIIVKATHSSGAAGSIYGILENNGASLVFDGNTANSEVIKAEISQGRSRGGICGTYKTNNLTNEFVIQNAKTQTKLSSGDYTGGLIGLIGDNPAYVKIDNVECTALQGASIGGGLIGSMGEGNTFVDVYGTTTINGSGSFNAGLVDSATYGVIRIQGITNLSGLSLRDRQSGQLVCTRGAVLVYALGDGSNSSSWLLKRNTSLSRHDDITGWGEVLRVDGTILSESDLFTVDVTSTEEHTASHTVTVLAEASTINNALTINNITDFAKTALNISLDTFDDAPGALCFASNNNSATILTKNITLGANITLAGTGLTGFARDNGANGAYSGTFNGGNHTITMTIGEVYGRDGSGNALAADSKEGYIGNHTYNGLFAETSGATIKDLNVAGYFNIHQLTGGVRVGGVTAYASKVLNINNVSCVYTINLSLDANYGAMFGGAIGEAGESGLNITINGSTSLTPTLVDATASSVSTGSYTYFGGAIGYLSSGSNQKIKFQSMSIDLDYHGTKNDGFTNNVVRSTTFGGFIGSTVNTSYQKGSREITIDTVALELSVKGAAHYSTDANGNKYRRFGGILGTEWLSVDTTIDDLTVDATIAAKGSGSDAYIYGGLAQTATGYMEINSITLSSASYDLPTSAPATFGFVANRTYKANDSSGAGLYLVVNNKGSNYDIDSLTFANSMTFDQYDELVADSRCDNNIDNNGNSIISITTSNDILATSGTANVYLNKTAYGKDNTKALNPNVRYYYNIDYARDNLATGKYKFLVWSVGKYAHRSLASWFTVDNTTFTGSLDMSGLSYYPVDVDGDNLTFSSATIKLDNITMEGMVKVPFTGATALRSTRVSGNQHYLMHAGLFRNYAGTLNMSTVTLQGNVPKYSDNLVGFVVMNQIGGADSGNTTINITSLTLDDARIVTISGGDLSTNAYAPLLINKIGKSTTMTINGASQSTTSYNGYAGSSKYAASSLIGNVGDANARAIYLTFGGLVFDSRSSVSSIGNMDTTYGTTKSIFSRATILNQLMYYGESSALYNFTIDEDWNSNGTAIHHVTYGKEITSSTQFTGLQKNYSGSEYYIHTTTYQATTECDFSTGFLPYVYEAYDSQNSKYEISINKTLDVQLIEGAGKYCEPFIIDDEAKLNAIASIISSGTGTGAKIQLPSDLTSLKYTALKTSYSLKTYAYGSPFTEVGGTATYNLTAVREYLSGAYYVITKNITFSSDVSIGEGNDYQFHGVIMGRDNPVITISTPKPLIYSSTGCVIKDLKVNVSVSYTEGNVTKHTISIATPTGASTYSYSGGLQSYGALIGQIMGGDTIIDGVDVTFDSENVSFVYSSNSNLNRLAPIGGYVGTLLNGGLIFRNMTSSNVGLTASTNSNVSDAGYLYVNPIIGRVIAGYAFHETSGEYHATEETATLKNGTKNYTIADLDSTSTKKISVTTPSNVITINVPDGQTLFILGAIVNSGAGAAPKGNSEQDYPSLSNFWQAYRTNTTTRAGATYDAVGTNGYSTDTDYTDYAIHDDSSSSAAKIPYIIRTYTLADETSGLYLARCVTSADGVALAISGTCDVAAGFRGFNSIYAYEDSLCLRVASVNGGNNTITLHMRYLEYDHNSVTAYRASDSSGISHTAGFGLFNYLKRTKISDNVALSNMKLAGDVFYDVYTIEGSQSQYLFNNYTNDNYHSGNNGIQSATVNSVNYHTNLSVGGLIGYDETMFTITNVTFSNLEVEGAKTAGGLVGCIEYLNETSSSFSSLFSIVYNEIASCDGYISVVGGLQAGGLIGRLYGVRLEIKGDSTSNTAIKIKNIEMKCATPHEVPKTYQTNVITGAGGLVGSAWSARKSGADQVTVNGSAGIVIRKFYVNNIDLVGLDGDDPSIISVRHNPENDPSKNNYAGGFVGSALGAIFNFTDCSISKINIKANAAGGIFGTLTQKYYFFLNNVNIGDDVNERSYSITGTRQAGGVVGYSIGRDTFYMAFDHVNIYRYNIISSYNGTSSYACAAGAIYGLTIANKMTDTATSSYPFELNNIHIKECYIRTNYGSTSNLYSGTGVIAGVLASGGAGDKTFNLTNSGEYKVKISGYNVLLENNIIKHYHKGNEATDQSTAATNQAIGEVVGNNIIGSSVRIIGLSLIYSGDNAYCGKICGKKGSNDNEYGTSSFKIVVGKDAQGKNITKDYGVGQIIFADYSMDQTNHTLDTVNDVKLIDDSTTVADNCNNVEIKEPYVTVNPAVTIGGYRFIGDAFALPVNNEISISSLPIADILDNQENNTVYSYVGNKTFYGNTNFYNANLAYGKLSMFKSEITQTDENYYIGTDFPVLVLEDEKTNQYINSYIRMITNSTYDYSVDQPGHFQVVIYNVTYANGKFTISTNNPSLQRNENGFYTAFNVFDSGKMQFSLIDIRYFNPIRPDNVVSHVYLPVFVKKVLSYQFDIAVLGGTTYLESEYSDKYGAALIENIGSPVTAYFKYTYTRTAAEWTDAINSGENVLRYYKKKLYLYKANTSDTLSPFDDDTLLSLSGPNNDGKVYYARLGDAMSDSETIDLSLFKQMVYENGELAITGDTFKPEYLCDLMTISVSDTGNDLNFVTCLEEDATIRVGTTYYRLATSEELADSTKAKYSLTVTGETVDESYYLTFFTIVPQENEHLFHYYLITSPTSFSEIDYPSKILDTGGHTMVHLVMGEIFYHDNIDVNSKTESQTPIITLENNKLSIDMKAEFGLSDDLDTDIRAYIQTLISVTPIYQSFLIQLNRNDANVITKIIAGTPLGEGKYGIDYDLDGEVSEDDLVNYSSGDIRINHNFAEYVTDNLSSYFATGNRFEIVANVSLTYLTSAAINSQFPGLSDSNPDNGTTVTGYSNLSFNKTTTSSSKNSITKNEFPVKTYNSEDVPEYAMLYLNPVEDRQGNISSLGINALEISGTTASFDLLAVLDTTTVRPQVEDYDNAIVTFELYKKTSGDYGESPVGNISDYITSIKVGGTTLTASELANGKIIANDNLADNGADITLPIITVTVKTGDALESGFDSEENHLYYSNYKLVVTVTLRDDENTMILASHASNFVVYTNAKVVPDFIVTN